MAARNVNRHRDKFLIDHPDLKVVVGDKNEELLRWADKTHYINFTKFDGEEFYTDFDLEMAKMWDAKINTGNS